MTEMGQESPRVSSQGVNKWSAVFLFAAVLPLFGYAGSIGLAEAQRWGAPTIQVAIEGYDPRDMFRGHYLQYRLSTEGGNAQGTYPTRACAGDARGEVSPVYLFEKPEDESRCRYELPLEFVQGVHRFYVQQTRARDLEKALMEGRARVTLSVVSNTHVAVEDLLIDGKPSN